MASATATRTDRFLAQCTSLKNTKKPENCLDNKGEKEKRNIWYLDSIQSMSFLQKGYAVCNV
jgi:hypothetical protein